GKTCRIGALSELKGNKLIVGTCQMDIDISDNGFKLKDAGACAQCAAGACGFRNIPETVRRSVFYEK
ncbi:MAG: hypothetical protein L7F78_02605, partial [Syntrophales bacterium LBB04]|nr:hypothetical protein [Syntrophales bacterium LBB04]